MKRRYWVLGSLGFAALVVITLVIVASRIPFRSETLRRRVVSTLSDRLKSEVELESLKLHFSPKLHAVGNGLVVRYRGRHDVPPLISVDSFTVTASLSGLWRRRVDHVRLDGLDIQIPPDRNASVKDSPDGPAQTPPASAATAQPPAAVSAGPGAAALGTSVDTPAAAADASATTSGTPSQESGAEPGTGTSLAKQVVISELEAPEATLTILRRETEKPARVWAMHSLRLREVGLDSAMPFESQLTNAVPPGEIAIAGRFGPWAADDPGLTPINGDFTFAHADLGVFKGISGILSAKGALDGVLNRIVVDGETDTPDFTVSVSGHPVPLKTRYHAIVDATNGNTTLDPVDATFLGTSLQARGGVYERKAGPGREVRLNIAIDGGRLEDVMRLAVKTPSAPMTGRLDLDTAFLLPPGKADVVEKLQLRGRFAIGKGHFTNADVQQKIATLSQRASGKTTPHPDAGKVRSDFTGRFALGGGNLSLPEVTFDVPGAVVELGGNYGLRSETLAFNGDLFMDAKISQTMTGFKSLLLKMVDPLFRKEGRTVIPLKIGGTRNDPQFGLDVKRVFRRGKSDDKAPKKAPAPAKADTKRGAAAAVRAEKTDERKARRSGGPARGDRPAPATANH